MAKISEAEGIERAAKELFALAKEYWLRGTNVANAEVGDMIVHKDDEVSDDPPRPKIFTAHDLQFKVLSDKPSWRGKLRGFGLALYAIGGDYLMGEVFDAAEDLTDSNMEFQLFASAVSPAWDGIGMWMS